MTKSKRKRRKRKRRRKKTNKVQRGGQGYSDMMAGQSQKESFGSMKKGGLRWAAYGGGQQMDTIGSSQDPTGQANGVQNDAATTLQQAEADAAGDTVKSGFSNMKKGGLTWSAYGGRKKKRRKYSFRKKKRKGRKKRSIGRKKRSRGRKKVKKSRRRTNRKIKIRFSKMPPLKI